MNGKLFSFEAQFRFRNCRVALSLAILTTASNAKDCECEFSTQKFHAYGTNGACGVFMYEKKSVCEISFVAAGASSKIANQIAGSNAVSETGALTRQLLDQFFTHQRSGKRGRFLDPKFITRTLPAKVGSVVFRQSVFAADVPVKGIYSDIVELSGKMSSNIADVFAQKAKPTKGRWSDQMTYEIGVGYVEVTMQGWV